MTLPLLVDYKHSEVKAHFCVTHDCIPVSRRVPGTTQILSRYMLNEQGVCPGQLRWQVGWMQMCLRKVSWDWGIQFILQSFWRVDIIEGTTWVPRRCQWYLSAVSHSWINVIHLDPFSMTDLITASHTCPTPVGKASLNKAWMSRRVSGAVQLRWNILGASGSQGESILSRHRKSGRLWGGLQSQDTGSWAEKPAAWILSSALMAPWGAAQFGKKFHFIPQDSLMKELCC